MMWLDLAELDRVFAGTRWWSTGRWALARFSRGDFLGDPAIPLEEAVKNRVFDEVGKRPTGPIRMLANLRYFGYIMNPLTCYYCFNDREQLEYIVAEVTNTPWKERHCYVLACEPEERVQRKEFKKRFHVSPFNPMAMTYRWWSDVPDRYLRIHMQNRVAEGNGQRIDFDASLIMQREEITPARLNRLLISYPLMTLKVIAAIYWEALKLFMKRVPFYHHPNEHRQDWRLRHDKI